MFGNKHKENVYNIKINYGNDSIKNTVYSKKLITATVKHLKLRMIHLPSNVSIVIYLR